jgi:hypothetical protein
MNYEMMLITPLFEIINKLKKKIHFIEHKYTILVNSRSTWVKVSVSIVVKKICYFLTQIGLRLFPYTFGMLFTSEEKIAVKFGDRAQ